MKTGDKHNDLELRIKSAANNIPVTGSAAGWEAMSQKLAQAKLGNVKKTKRFTDKFSLLTKIITTSIVLGTIGTFLYFARNNEEPIITTNQNTPHAIAPLKKEITPLNVFTIIVPVFDKDQTELLELNIKSINEPLKEIDKVHSNAIDTLKEEVPFIIW